MKQIKRSQYSHAKAQGLVEFALISPLLLVLLMATIEFGWILFNYVQVNNALREGLRYGSVPSFSGTDQFRDCRNIYTRIEKLAQTAGIGDSNITVYYDNGYSTSASDSSNITGTCSLPGPFTGTLNNGQRIVIQMNVSIRLLTPFFSSLLSNGVQLTYRGARTLYPSGAIVQ